MPDAPVNLVNVPEITTGTTIGLAWDDGANDGGTPILDYHVAFAYDDVDFVSLETGVATRSYTVIDLTPG